MASILFKEGVEIDFSCTDGVSRNILWHMLEVAANVYDDMGHTAVVTSIMDGKHSRNSLHYRGLAIDLRTRFFKTEDQKEDATFKLQIELGGDYDVVLESDHIHVEYDPDA